MGNQQVFKRRQHQTTDVLGYTHHFTYVVYEAEADRLGRLDHLAEEAVVTIKGYRVVINETVEHSGEFAYTRDYDLGFLSTRTSEVHYLLVQLRRCKGLEEIQSLVEDLKVDFNVAIERDTRKALRELLGLRTDSLTNKLVSTKRNRPKPLKIPYRKTTKRK